MYKYRWTCKACNSGNASQHTHCQQCGCSATASTNDLEERLDPEIRQRKKAHYTLVRATLFLSHAPTMLILALCYLDTVLLLFIIAHLSLITFISRERLGYIINDKWVRNMLLILSLSLTSFAVVHIYWRPYNEHTAIVLSFLGIVLHICFFGYFFKHTHWKALFNAYYKANKSTADN